VPCCELPEAPTAPLAAGASLPVAACRPQSLAIVPQGDYAFGVAERRSKGDDSIYFEHNGPCNAGTRHRRCQGRWRGETTTGRSTNGKRVRRRVSGPSKAAVQDELKALRREVDAGLTKPAPSNYTVRRCCEDSLADGLPGRDLQTIEKNWPGPADY
jgi:hypothetical protein